MTECNEARIRQEVSTQNENTGGMLEDTGGMLEDTGGVLESSRSRQDPRESNWFEYRTL
jgi:hypothetical protein